MIQLFCLFELSETLVKTLAVLALAAAFKQARWAPWRQFSATEAANDALPRRGRVVTKERKKRHQSFGSALNWQWKNSYITQTKSGKHLPMLEKKKDRVKNAHKKEREIVF